MADPELRTPVGPRTEQVLKLGQRLRGHTARSPVRLEESELLSPLGCADGPQEPIDVEGVLGELWLTGARRPPSGIPVSWGTRGGRLGPDISLGFGQKVSAGGAGGGGRPESNNCNTAKRAEPVPTYVQQYSCIALQHYSITAITALQPLQHYSITALQALQQYCSTALQQYSITAVQHYSHYSSIAITALQHYSITALQHYSITASIALQHYKPLQQYCITALQHYSITALQAVLPLQQYCITAVQHYEGVQQ